MLSINKMLRGILPLLCAASCHEGINKNAEALTADEYRNEKNIGPGAEEYGIIKENKFLTATETPLSTFSIDVDRASYSNVRRFINDGQIPPEGAVRLEELINYFDYDYEKPAGNDPLSINTEIAACPWNEQHRLVHIGLKGKEVSAENLPPANLVFLIDVSGSMSDENKLPLVKQAMKLLTDQLREKDRVAIVTYAGQAGVALPSTSGKNKDKIKDAIDVLEAGGSTAGAEGIITAYKIAQENFVKNGNNRVILATDGDFNVGTSSDEALVALIEKKRASDIFLTVLGFGTGNYKDHKMEQLADKGNGNNAYIDNLNEAKKVLVNEFGSTLFTIAKDVKLQVEFNPANVAAYRLIGYENRMLQKEDFNNDQKDAGEMGAGHTVTALYEIIPAGISDRFITDSLKYKRTAYRETELTNEMLTIKIRYKDPMGTESKLLVKPVLNGNTSQENTSDNFRLSAAVAEFGMLLRNSEFKQKASYENAVALAKSAAGKDDNGYRTELIALIKAAALLKENDDTMQ